MVGIFKTITYNEMAVLDKQIYKFKKGQIVHLDEIMEIQAFVIPYAKPYRNPYLSRWTEDLTDEHKMLKNITVEITVRGRVLLGLPV